MAHSKPFCKPSGSKDKTSKDTSDFKEDLSEEVHFKNIFDNLSSILPVIEINESLANKTNNIHDGIIKKEIVDQESLKQLINEYQNIWRGSIIEEKRVRKILNIVYTIQNQRLQKKKSHQKIQKTSNILKLLHREASKLPVWIPPSNDKQIMQPCGRIEPDPSYVAKCGDLVAALVIKTKEENNWILATVVEFKNEKYHLEDIDIEESNRQIVLKKEYVKPLPFMRADPKTCPEAFFTPNEFVLALYPQTTCFFKALVKTSPKTCHDKYEVLFEDNPKKYTISIMIPQQFVLQLPMNL